MAREKRLAITIIFLWPFWVWLNIFNSLQFEDYKWQWSDNNSILAGQYLINGIWACSMVFGIISCVMIVPLLIAILSGDLTKKKTTI